MVRQRLCFVIVLCFVLLQPQTVAAANNKGLYVSPVRDYVSVDAGESISKTFTVANLTDSPMQIDLSVQQFSVTDFTYDYTFKQPNDTWVNLAIKQISLKPNESKRIPYQLTVPVGSAPGGHYYTLLVSTRVPGSALPATIQAAVLLYATVNGNLVRTSQIQNASIQHIVMGNTILYSFDIKNTGNVHYFAYVSGQLDGLFTKSGPTGTSHILLPGTTRAVSGSIATPLLPGIYKATYGYQVDQSLTPIVKTGYIVFLPPWSLVAIFLLGLSLRWVYRKRKQAIHF